MLSELVSNSLRTPFTDNFEIGHNSLDITDTPVIGIVTQDLPSSLQEDPRFEGLSTYVMSAYVNYLEAFGARVVPIISGESDQETMGKLAVLNGVLFPGGDGDQAYHDKARFIFDEVTKINDAGEYYPLWGTCMGF